MENYETYGHGPAVPVDCKQPVAGSIEDDALRERVRDAVAENLVGLYYCGRVWSAWSVGTMGEDDFSPAEDDDDIISNITDAVFAHIDSLRTAAPAAPVEQAASVAQIKRALIGLRDGWATRADADAAIALLTPPQQEGSEAGNG